MLLKLQTPACSYYIAYLPYPTVMRCLQGCVKFYGGHLHAGPCAVHLINAGVRKEQDTTTIEFVGTNDVSGYLCSIDKEAIVFCRSPLRYSGLSSGTHRLLVSPTGCDGEKLSIKFETE